MSLNVGCFPNCCGAKILYGFPSGIALPDEKDTCLVSSYIETNGLNWYESAKKKNKELSGRLREDIKDFFNKGFAAFHMGAIYRTPFPSGGERNYGLSRNAWVFAITNSHQDHLCGPVLKEFGFEKIKETVNPNSGNMIYFYILCPTGPLPADF